MLSSLLLKIRSLFLSKFSIRPGSTEEFRQTIGDENYFTKYDYDVNLDTMQSLEKQAAWLNQYRSYNIFIEGHCDPEEGTLEFCLALGERRAENARKYLSKFVDPNRIEIATYGKSRPAYVNGDYRNRRIITIPR